MAKRGNRARKTEQTKWQETDTVDMLLAKYNGDESVKDYEKVCALLIQHAKDFDNFPFLREGICLELAKMRAVMALEGYKEIKTENAVIFSKMTDEQLKQILPFLNERCFKNPLTLEQLKEVFQYKRTHVQIKSVPVLAYFFDALKEKGLLADGWQTTIQEKEMFVSKSGKPLNQRYIGRKITELLGTKDKDRKRTGGRLKEYEVIKKDDALRVSLKWKKVKGGKSYTPRIKDILQAVKDADDTIKLL